MPPKPRAVWTSNSDAILLEVLMKERDDGKQTSNGNWHSDAWSAAKTALSGTELLTGGCPKTSTSCQYRWNALKEYKEVNYIRGLSGFGWDSTKKVVTAGPEVWDALIKAHPTYKKWLTHSFPPFDEMQDLIEGTYATGQGAFHPHSVQPSKDVGLPDESSDEEFNDLNIDPSLLIDKQSPSPASLSQSSTPSFPTSLAPSTSPDPASVLSQKRRIPDEVEVPLAKRLKHEGHRHGHGRKPSSSLAILDMASSIDRLASAMVGPSISLAPSPECKKQAIHLVEDDGDLSEEEMIQVMKLVRRDTSFADTILAIQKKQRRTNYIKSELSNDDL